MVFFIHFHMIWSFLFFVISSTSQWPELWYVSSLPETVTRYNISLFKCSRVGLNPKNHKCLPRKMPPKRIPNPIILLPSWFSVNIQYARTNVQFALHYKWMKYMDNAYVQTHNIFRFRNVVQLVYYWKRKYRFCFNTLHLSTISPFWDVRLLTAVNLMPHKLNAMEPILLS